jgi:hypothetical protein
MADEVRIAIPRIFFYNVNFQYQKSILEFLDPTQINCLNESLEHNLKGIVGSRSVNKGPSYLLSDADEQLIIGLPVRPIL